MSEKTDRIKSHLTRIENRYNPEFDVPDGPQVTYTDYQLLEVCKALVIEVETLTAKYEDLLKRVEGWEE